MWTRLICECSIVFCVLPNHRDLFPGEPDAAQADEDSESQGTHDSSHAGMTKAQTEQLA